MFAEDISQWGSVEDRTLVEWPPDVGAGGDLTTPGVPSAAGYPIGLRISDSGEIYESRNAHAARPFVVKLFRRSTEESSVALKWFCREAVRAAKLGHPNIARIFDVGVIDAGHRNRIPFLAVERLAGRTLDERMARLGSLPLYEVLTVVKAVAGALSAAHEAGIVHREIRPDNIFVVEGSNGAIESVKVLDFGVSRLTWGPQAEGLGITATAARYLAPEQEHGGVEAVDASVDQFALAALTWQFLMDGDSFVHHSDLSGSALTQSKAGPILIAGRGGDAVESVLSRALSDRPEDRFASVDVFVQALEDALSQEATPAPIIVANAAADDDQDAADRLSDDDTRVRVARSRAPLVVTTLILLTGIAGLGSHFLGWKAPRAVRDVNLPLAALLLGTKASDTANKASDTAKTTNSIGRTIKRQVARIARND